MKRLIRKSDNNMDVGRPSPYLVPQYEFKIENDNISDIQYGPSIRTDWSFGQDMNYPEWNLTI